MTEKHKKMIDELYNNTPAEVKEKYDKKSGIYGIFCDEELVYIGKSTNLLNRWIAHKCHTFCDESKEYNRPIYKELRRAYSLGHKINIRLIEYCEVADLEKEEAKYIYGYRPKLNTLIPFPSGGQTRKSVECIC